MISHLKVGGFFRFIAASFVWFSLYSPGIYAETGKVFEGTISNVTIFSDQAIVSVKGDIDVIPGVNSYTLMGLPANLSESSLRFSVQSSWVSINDIKVEREFSTKFLSAERERLEKKLEALQGDNEKRRRRLGALYDQYHALTGVTVKPPMGPQGVEKWPLKTAEWPQLIGFLERNLGQILKSRQRELLEISKNVEEIAKVQHDLSQLSGKRIHQEYGLSVKLESKQSGKFGFELRFLVPNARWYPVYDLQVDSRSQTAHLVASAWVVQETGYDWNKVKLSVSSAIPNFDLDLPQWRARVISETMPQHPLSHAKSAFREKDTVEDSNKVKNDEGALRQRFDKDAQFAANKKKRVLQKPSAPPMPAEEEAPVGGRMRGQASGRFDDTLTDQVLPSISRKESKGLPNWWFENEIDQFRLKIAEVPQGSTVPTVIDRYPPNQSAGGFDYRYDALKPETIQSSATGKRVPLARLTVPIELYRIAHPSVSKHVFIEGKLQNTTDKPLLSGTVFLYVDGAYVGRESLPTLGKSAYGKVALGVDRQVKLDRTHTRKREEKGLIIRDHVTEHVIDTEITNLRKHPIHFLVREHLPSYHDEKIVALELGDVEPKLVRKLKKNHTLMEWQGDIPATKKKRIHYDYKISHRANLYVDHEAIP